MPAFAGFLAVAAIRLLTLPESLWEWDEILFLQGVVDFDPLHHHPHPPGYPLYIGLGKVFALVFRDPYWGLVALGVAASLVGYAALVSAFRRLGGDPAVSASSGTERVAVGGALGSLLRHGINDFYGHVLGRPAPTRRRPSTSSVRL